MQKSYLALLNQVLYRSASFTLVLITFISTFIYSQIETKSKSNFDSTNVEIVVEGLSEEYIVKFKDGREKLLNRLNAMPLPNSIKPITVKVRLGGNYGIIIAELNYDSDDVFKKDSHYQKHNELYRAYGQGISIFLQLQLFSILREYKYEVAKIFSSQPDGVILAFQLGVRLVKPNKDEFLILGKDNLKTMINNSFDFPPLNIYDTAYLSISGKKYSINCIDSKELNDHYFFYVNGSKVVNDKKSPEYLLINSFSPNN